MAQDATSTLSAMFPDADPTLLQNLYEIHDRDIGATIDAVLAQNTKKEVTDTTFMLENFLVLTPKSILRKPLKNSVDSPTFSDVILVAQDGEVHAHRVLLDARSEYFRAMLSSIPQTKGGDKPRLSLDTMPKALLLLVMEYLYTDFVRIPQELKYDLLVVSQKLCIKRLVQMCEGGRVMPSTYSDDLVKTLNNPKRYPGDIILIVEDKEIHAHRVVLTASEYFRAMFLGGMIETSQKTIVIPDTSYSSFLVYLDALYGNGRILKGRISPDNALEVFIVANRYMFNALQVGCEDIVRSALDVGNVCQILEMTMNMSPTLQTKCKQFIFNNYKKCSQTVGFKSMDPSLREEIAKRFETENEGALSSFMAMFSKSDYQDIASAMKMEIKSFLTQRLNEVKIDEQSGETASPVGNIKYTIKNLVITPPAEGELVNMKNIVVEFGQTEITIKIENLNVCLKEIGFNYDKESFPKMKDEGSLDAFLESMSMSITFKIASAGLGIPSLSLGGFEVSLGACRLVFQESSVSWLYNLFSTLFSGQIRVAIETQLLASLRDNLEGLTQNINQLAYELATGNM